MMISKYTICEMAKIMRQVVCYKGILIFDVTEPDGAPIKLIDISRLAKMGWNNNLNLKEGPEKTHELYLEGGI